MRLSRLLRISAARYKRRFGAGRRWIAITGSVGKSTTSALVSSVLGRRGSVVDGTVVSRAKSTEQLIQTMLATGRKHRYRVVEVPAGAHSAMRRDMQRLRPDIGIVTKIADDHRAFYRTLENTARVKSEVVRGLSRDGVAILNADDPLVWAMRHVAQARVIGCGWSPQATLRIEGITGDWPERMTVQIRHGSQLLDIPTRFLGDYAAFPVVAALAAGLAEGIRLEDAAAAIAMLEPLDGRFKPFKTKDGITFIDNSWKSPFHIVPNALDFMAKARAPRKIVVIGSISDFTGKSGRRYRSVARKALDAADIVIFSGRWASSAIKLHDTVAAGRLMAFEDTRLTREALGELLRPGDLVLLQGSQRADHLDRIVLDRFQPVDCWRTNCGRLLRCRQCELLAQQDDRIRAAAN